MESTANLPTGSRESKTMEPDQHPVGADAEKEISRPIIQRAEDNPRAVEITTSRIQPAFSKGPQVAAPTIQAQQPPQTFSNSQWARRNARIKAIQSFFPGNIISTLCMIAGFCLFL